MKKYARVVDGVAVELIELPADWDLANVYVPEIAATILPVAAKVKEGWLYDGSSFAAPPQPAGPSLEEAKVNRIAELTSLCGAAIVGGYVSSALGAPYTYPSGITDQINMMGSVTASLLPDLSDEWKTPFWCANEDGEWAFRDHSMKQIRAAGSDGKSHVVTIQGTLEYLTVQVAASETVEAVDGIVWPVE